MIKGHGVETLLTNPVSDISTLRRELHEADLCKLNGTH